MDRACGDRSLQVRIIQLALSKATKDTQAAQEARGDLALALEAVRRQLMSAEERAQEAEAVAAAARAEAEAVKAQALRTVVADTPASSNSFMALLGGPASAGKDRYC